MTVNAEFAGSILNNDGYSCERVIHGEKRVYNDIGNWQWQKLLEVFGPVPRSYASHKISTRQELEGLLTGPLLRDRSKLHLVECVLEKMDAPRHLRHVGLTKHGKVLELTDS